jgi:hypothetical protein
VRAIEVDLAHLPPEERVEVVRTLEPHHRMWDGRLGTVAATTHRIDVHPGSKPVHAQPYRAGFRSRVAEKTEIDRMLAQQVIEPATCEWASPIVLVPKPRRGPAILRGLTEIEYYNCPRHLYSPKNGRVH